MKMIRQTNPISPRAYFANIAKYTEAAMEINRISTDSGLFCAVCGDVSSGKHYGILACNGCSGFFKRSVRRKLIYRCQVNANMCVIDKAHRNQCQACRYNKCLQMGMVKEAVQNERPPRNPTHIDPPPARKISVLYPRSSEQTNLPSSDSSRSSDLLNHLDDTISSELLLMIIKWLRNLPTFSNLPIDDQVFARSQITSSNHILLKETWTELFLLSAIHYSISIDNEGFLLNRLGENEKFIKDIFDAFKKIKLDSIELTCLKAITLFRFDIRALKQANVIESLQDQAQMALAQFTQMHNPTRFGRLLLTLPLLRSVPSQWIEQTYFPRLSISKFLVDMFANSNKK